VPRLVKGAKWTYGWVIVGTRLDLPIPPAAWAEFGFEEGGQAVFLRGSSRSGGFSVSTPRLLDGMSERLGSGAPTPLAPGRFGESSVVVPPHMGVRPGDRLLTARGSRYGLAFVARGPIYDEALAHPELDVFAAQHQEEDIGS
jgi:hypothetical protein